MTMERSEFEIREEDMPTFKSIIGMDELKNQLRVSMIEPLKNPLLFDQLDLAAGDKFLLYGPPGCGKSFFVRAVGGELNARCFELKPSSTVARYDATSCVKNVFEKARYDRPSVIIIDEVETLTEDRDTHANSPFMRVFLNEMLIQFDDTVNNNEKIVISGTTNCPWYIDGAFLREGRFNQAIFVAPPDVQSRRDFILRHTDQLSEKCLDKLVSSSHMFSFADMLGAIKKCKRNAVKKALMKGQEITHAHEITLDEDELIGCMQGQLSPIQNWFHKFEEKSAQLDKVFIKSVQEYLMQNRKSA